MKGIRNNKPIVLSLVIFVLVMGIYQLFLKPTPVIDTIVTEETGEQIGKDIIELNEQLQRITFDRSVLSSAPYKALVDFTTVVSPQPLGRSNPFGPIGNE